MTSVYDPNMDQRFNNAANTWDKSDVRQLLAEAVFQTIQRHHPLDKSMKVLDFGAGTGLLSFKIAPYVAQVTAVDLSEKMLDELAAKNSATIQIKTRMRDILKDPLPETFDLIISSMAMHHVPDTRALLTSLYAHLRPGGAIAIADLDQEDGSFHSDGNAGVHHFGFDKSALTALLKETGFTDISFYPAHTIEKVHRDFDIFLLKATKAYDSAHEDD